MSTLAACEISNVLAQFAECADCLERALSANSVHSAWFTLGCVRMQLSKWEDAVVAFRRAALLEPDNYQAWTNLATALVHAKHKYALFRALLIRK